MGLRLPSVSEPGTPVWNAWQNVVSGTRLSDKVWVRDLFFTSRFVISPSRLTCVRCKRKLKSSATGRKQQRKNRKKFHFLTFVVLRLSFGHACEPVSYEQLRNLDHLQLFIICFPFNRNSNLILRSLWTLSCTIIKSSYPCHIMFGINS